MNNKTKKILTISSVVILGGVITYLVWKWKKNKKEPKKQTLPNYLKDAFDNLNFEFGKADIKKDSLPYLDELAETLLEAGNWILEIQGHTDDKGTEQFNMKLSQNRANAVKKYLVSKGVKEESVTAVGFGESKPVVPNDSEKNRAINRRVEFIITKPDGEVETTVV